MPANNAFENQIPEYNYYLLETASYQASTERKEMHSSKAQ